MIDEGGSQGSKWEHLKDCRSRVDMKVSLDFSVTEPKLVLAGNWTGRLRATLVAVRRAVAAFKMTVFVAAITATNFT